MIFHDVRQTGISPPDREACQCRSATGPSAFPTPPANSGAAREVKVLAEVRSPGWRDRNASHLPILTKFNGSGDGEVLETDFCESDVPNTTQTEAAHPLG